MCRGRHQVENRVGVVQARGGRGGRISFEAIISAFLYKYKAAFSASRPHEPYAHSKTKIPETDSVIDKESSWSWGHHWSISRSECSSGLWFRLRYSRSESPQTTKTLTLLEIPESTAHFGLPSHPTPTGTNRADDYDAQCPGLVRSLGLAESI